MQHQRNTAATRDYNCSSRQLKPSSLTPYIEEENHPKTHGLPNSNIEKQQEDQKAIEGETHGESPGGHRQSISALQTAAATTRYNSDPIEDA